MFDYVREQSDNLMKELYDSSFSIMATVYIAPIEVPAESQLGIPTTFDEKHPIMVKKTYPYNLKPVQRVKVFLIEESGLRIEEFRYTSSTRTEPYDTWVTCPESEVKVTNKSTLFDLAKNISIHGTNYIIKGLIRETFGLQPMLHIFLTKETQG